MGEREALKNYFNILKSYPDNDTFCVAFALDGLLGGRLTTTDYDRCVYHEDGVYETQILAPFVEKGLLRFSQYTLLSITDPLVELLHQSIESDKVVGIMLVEPGSIDQLHIFSIKGKPDWFGRVKYFDSQSKHKIGITGFEDALRRATHSVSTGLCDENNVTVIYKGPKY